MKEVYDQYLSELRTGGLGENEAVRLLATIRDWSKDVYFPRLRARRDEYRCSVDRRMRLAEDGLDFCEFWLRLQAGGASESQLSDFTNSCENMSVQDILYWLSCQDLTDIYVYGMSVLMAETGEID